jgi:hypothetical protein
MQDFLTIGQNQSLMIIRWLVLPFNNLMNSLKKNKTDWVLIKMHMRAGGFNMFYVLNDIHSRLIELKNYKTNKNN